MTSRLMGTAGRAGGRPDLAAAETAGVRAEWEHGVSGTTIRHLSPGHGCPGN